MTAVPRGRPTPPNRPAPDLPALDDRGAVTVEAALALGAFVVVLAMALSAVAAAATQLHCVDAAREAARLAARGDLAGAQRLAAQIAPGSTLSVRRDGTEIRAEVTAEPAGGLLPGVYLRAFALALPESDAVPGNRRTTPGAQP